MYLQQLDSSDDNSPHSADFQNTQGIIFVVDSNDRERVIEAREELQRMLNEDELRDALLLVFANKQDLPNAMSAADITDKLGLTSLRNRNWYIQAACATSGDGLYEGLEWVSGKPWKGSSIADCHCAALQLVEEQEVRAEGAGQERDGLCACTTPVGGTRSDTGYVRVIHRAVLAEMR